MLVSLLGFRLTVSLESLEAIVGSLKISSPGHNEIPKSFLKEFFHLLSPVMLKKLQKNSNRESSRIVKKKAKTIPIFKAGDMKKTK